MLRINPNLVIYTIFIILYLSYLIKTDIVNTQGDDVDKRLQLLQVKKDQKVDKSKVNESLDNLPTNISNSVNSDILNKKEDNVTLVLTPGHNDSSTTETPYNKSLTQGKDNNESNKNSSNSEINILEEKNPNTDTTQNKHNSTINSPMAVNNTNNTVSETKSDFNITKNDKVFVPKTAEEPSVPVNVNFSSQNNQVKAVAEDDKNGSTTELPVTKPTEQDVNQEPTESTEQGKYVCVANKCSTIVKKDNITRSKLDQSWINTVMEEELNRQSEEIL